MRSLAARRPRRLAAGVGACALVLGACDGSTAPPPVPVALEPQGTLQLSATAGAVTPAPRVLVRSNRGAPLRDALVHCAIESGTGRLSIDTVRSGADGIAHCGEWTHAQVVGVEVARMVLAEVDTVRFTATIVAGPAARLILQPGMPSAVRAGFTVTPAAAVALADQFGNPATGAGTTVTLSTDGSGVTLLNATAETNADGVARFDSLGVIGPPVVATWTFSAPGLTAVTTPLVPIVFPEPDSMPSTLVLDGPTGKVMIANAGDAIPLTRPVVRNASGLPIGGALFSVETRSPSLLRLNADGTVTALETGRAFVSARTLLETPARDSVVVHVTRNATGPILRTDLTTFDLATAADVDVRVFLDTRSSGPVATITADVAYPQSSPSLLSLTSTTAAANTTVAASTIAGLVRFTYVNVTGASGTIELGTIRFRTQAGTPANSELILTPLQVVSATLQDLTGVTSVVNPTFIVK